jgi:hypothetical protein
VASKGIMLMSSYKEIGSAVVGDKVSSDIWDSRNEEFQDYNLLGRKAVLFGR